MVPKDLRAALGKREFTKAIRAATRQDAVAIAWPILEEWGALIKAARHPASKDEPAPSSPDTGQALVVPNIIELQIAAAKMGFETILSRLEKMRDARSFKDNDEYERYYKSLSGQLMRLIRTREGDSVRLWEQVADRQIKAAGWLLPKESDEYATFIRMISEASLEAIRVEIERGKGNLGAEPSNKAVIAGLNASAGMARPGESIMELFELYGSKCIINGDKREAGVDQDRMVLRLFAQFVGEKRAVSSITQAEAREFRNMVAKLPVSFGKKSAYSGLNIRQVVEKGREIGDDTISPVTAARYLSTVSPFFKWLKSEGYTETLPFDGLHERPKKNKNPRPPFSTDQLNKILSSPLFTGYQADGAEHLPGNCRASDWRYWIPLICLFTGARIGEVAQLHVGDIRREHDIWFVHFRHEEKTGQQTKSNRSRAIPVHSMLIAIGLLDFHARQSERAAKEGNPQLFPELKPGKRKQFGDGPSEWWRDYLDKIGIKDGKDGIGAHSFRHTMADQLRSADYLDHEFGPLILGHSNKNVTSGYGALTHGTADRLRTMIETVKFPGVDFSVLDDRNPCQT